MDDDEEKQMGLLVMVVVRDHRTEVVISIWTFYKVVCMTVIPSSKWL